MIKQLISVSIDDGHPLDLKVAEILAKKNIPTTFYVPIKNSTGKPTLNKNQIKNLSQNPLFKIGGHTYNHFNLTKLPLEEAEKEIRKGKEELEDIIGKKVTTFAWPWGKYNGRLIEVAKKIGFLDCRSSRICNFGISDKKNFLWHPNFHLYPHSRTTDLKSCIKNMDLYSLFMTLINLNKAHLDLIKSYVEKNDVHIWLHSWEIEQFGLWHILEKL